MSDRSLRRFAGLCMGWAMATGAGMGAPLAEDAVRARAGLVGPVVVAAHPLAAEAGLAILRDGGSAADAAIATQMVLGLVEPQASGIGGGALLLSYAAPSGKVVAYDGRETAPAAAGPDLFLDRAGKPLDFAAAGSGGRAVGVPGVVRMLEALHRREGRLPWERLFAPAIRLAELGFPVSPRLARELAENADGLRRQPAARALFFRPDGAPLATGDTLVNRPLADTLRAIAAGGADALHRGPIAAEIATTVRGDANAGLLTADDLAAYAARIREPICGTYRDRRICTVGPPSSGGVTLLQTLGMLRNFDLAALAPTGDASIGVEAAHLLIEAERLAQADRTLYLADPDFARVPLDGLLDRDYLVGRAGLIGPERAISALQAGALPVADRQAPAPAQPEHGTSHIAVVDAAGNAISMTTSVQDAFGARLVVRGFVLNNQLTDFSFVPERDGAPVANRVEPGKRPLSAMAPTMVFDAAGRLEMLAGSAGGGDIPSYVTQALVGLLDWRLPPEAALAAGHVTTTGEAVRLEAGTAAAALAEPLRARGHRVEIQKLDSGLAVVAATPAGPSAAADPRREGIAATD